MIINDTRQIKTREKENKKISDEKTKKDRRVKEFH